MRNAVRAELTPAGTRVPIGTANLHPAELSMATYPSLSDLPKATGSAWDGIATDEGGDGSLWVRQMYPTDKYASTVAHVVNASGKSTLEAFYSANDAAVRLRVSRRTATTVYRVRVRQVAAVPTDFARNWRATVQIRQPMTRVPDITTGPGSGNPLLVNQPPIIPVVPVIPSIRRAAITAMLRDRYQSAR